MDMIIYFLVVCFSYFHPPTGPHIDVGGGSETNSPMQFKQKKCALLRMGFTPITPPLLQYGPAPAPWLYYL